MAGEWVVGGAEAKGFSFVLVFLALEAMVEGYWNRMWLLLGFASAFHILVGGWAAVAAGAVWMLQGGLFCQDASAANSPAASSPPKRPFRFVGRASSWIAPLLAFLLALPGLVPALLMNRGVEPAVTAQAHRIYVFERFPHHLDPAKFWADGFVLPFLLLVGLWLLLWPTASDSPGARRLRGFTAVGGGHCPDRGGDQPVGPLQPGTGRRLDAILLVSTGRRGRAAGPCAAERAVVRRSGRCVQRWRS